MSSEKEAFANYLAALDQILNGSTTIAEAIAYIERTDGPEYAEIARQGFRDVFGEDWSRSREDRE